MPSAPVPAILEESKNMKTLLSIVVLLASIVATRAEIITLLAFDDPTFPPDPTTHKSESVEITADQTAELLSIHPTHDNNQFIRIEKAGQLLVWSTPATGEAQLRPLVVRGPAKLTLTPQPQKGSAMATFRITPERVDPTKTVIVYPGTNNAAQVTLLCSTNLTDWFPATNGVYSGPVAKFFRIGLEKVEK